MKPPGKWGRGGGKRRVPVQCTANLSGLDERGLLWVFGFFEFMVGARLLGFSGTAAFVPSLVNCCDSIAIRLAGTDMGIVKGWTNDGFGGRDALPGAIPFSAVDYVAGQI
jgi:hypothetical protein